MTNREVFKKALPEYMKKANLNQRELAKAVGVSESTVHCWVHGKAFPEINTIQRITDVLGCKTDDLLVDDSIGNRLIDVFMTASQPFHPSVIASLEARIRQETPKEDAEMVALWRSASPVSKRAAIAVLKSMEGWDKK